MATHQLFVCCSKPARTSKHKTLSGLLRCFEWVDGSDRLRIYSAVWFIAVRYFISPHAMITCPLFAFWLTPKRNSTLLPTSSVNFSRFTTLKLMKSLYFCVSRETAVYLAASNGHAKVVHWLAKVRYYVSVRFFLYRSRYFMFWNILSNIFIMFLRMAPIFSSRIYTSRHICNDYFGNYQFASILPFVDL